MMKRWDLEVLVDYLRGLGDPRTRAAIEADLEAGAAETAADLAFLREVADVVRADGSAGPSTSAVRAAQSVFALGSLDGPGAVPFLPFQMQAAASTTAVGYRDLEAGHREVRLEGERFELVLSIDATPGGVDVVVLGRLAPARRERWSAESVPVALVAGERILATTETNRFGEFHVEGESEEDDMELRLTIADLGRIRFTIDRPQLDEAP